MKNPPKVALGLSAIILVIGFNICESSPFLIAPAIQPLVPDNTLARTKRSIEEQSSIPVVKTKPRLSWAERHRGTREKVADIERRRSEEERRKREVLEREAMEGKGGKEQERARRKSREAALLETKSPFKAMYKGRELPVWRECIRAGIGAWKHPCQGAFQFLLPEKMYFWKRGYYDEEAFGKKYFSTAWVERFDLKGEWRYTRVEEENVWDNILEARNNLWKQRKSFEFPPQLINSFKKAILFQKGSLAFWGEAPGGELVNFYEVFGEEYFKEALFLALILTHNFLNWQKERKGGYIWNTFGWGKVDLLQGQFTQKQENLFVGIDFATVEDFLRYIWRHIKLDLSELEDPLGPQYVNIVDNFNIRDLLGKSYYKPGPWGW